MNENFRINPRFNGYNRPEEGSMIKDLITFLITLF